jgi:hypothetical protein
MRRVLYTLVSFTVLVPWLWRRTWAAAGQVIQWEQADLDYDVVSDDVWANIVATIENLEVDEDDRET